MTIEREARECIELTALDGRYWASEKAKEDAAVLWAHEFRNVKLGILRDACLASLRLKPKGRPSLGDMWAEIRKLSPHIPPGSPIQALNTRKRVELEWAISILEDPSPFEGAYQHTIEYADKIIHHWDFASFVEAGTYLNPNYIPPNGM